MSTTVSANDHPSKRQNLPPEKQKESREPYRDSNHAKTVMRDLTSEIREYLVGEGYISDATLNIEDSILGQCPDSDDFENLYVNAVWNDVEERGEALLQTRIDIGDVRIKLVANVTGDVGSAVVHDGDEIIEEPQTTSSGDVTTEAEETCSWTSCVAEDTYCNYCCNDWIGPTNYRISYACTKDDGTVVTTMCSCYHDSSCRFDCDDHSNVN